VVVKSDVSVWFTDPPFGILGPNGLCFSPDETILYVVESQGVPHRKIPAYDVAGNGRDISNKRVHIDAGPGGTPDGMRCDLDGNLWCGWGMGTAALDGVLVFDPDGAKIGRIACRNAVLTSVWWPQAQPPLRGRQPIPLCSIREHPGCTWGPDDPASVKMVLKAVPAAGDFA
jgi:hypothetical protein